MRNFGYCLPVCSCSFLKNLKRKKITIIDAMNIIKPPFNVNMAAQVAGVAALKDKSFINKSVKHNLIWANKIKKVLNKLNIITNEVAANFYC